MNKQQLGVAEIGALAPVRRVQVLVVGGGVTGVCAAVAASRSGCEVLLVERTARLGGNFTLGLIGTFCGFYARKENGGLKQCVGGLADQVLRRLDALGETGRQQIMEQTMVSYHAPDLEYVLDNMVVESGVRVLFHQHAFGVEMGGEKISRVLFAGKGGVCAVEADMVIDATGDGDIAAKAGVPALQDGGSVQFPSTTFHISGIDLAKAAGVTKMDLRALAEKAVASGKHHLVRTDGTMVPMPHSGEVRCNIGRLKIDDRPIDPLNIDEVSWAELEGRRQAYTYLNFIRDCVPGYEKAYIVRMAAGAGIRESRRLQGLYVVTEEDVVSARKFEDGILCSTWPIEQHKEGTTTRWVLLPEDDWCQVPMRSLIPQRVSNLFFAGRSLSAEQAAQAAVRAGAPCMCMGEAVGVAAGHCLSRSVSVQQTENATVIKELRARGAFLPT